MMIDFLKLNYSFKVKPLLVGGKAMEYYGLRKAGDDIDLIVVKEDIAELINIYPTKLKDLGGDFGIAVHDFEIWKTIRYFDYDYWAQGAIQEDNCLVISLEKLLLQKALAMSIPKYYRDLKLIVEEITKRQQSQATRIGDENIQLIASISNVEYIEKK